MKLTFKNYDTNEELSFNTNKKFIIIYGKNGVGKTTISRNEKFDKKYVFNEDFIYSNVFNISEKGFIQSPTTKENFSGLWIGENIVKIRQDIAKIMEKEKYVSDELSKIEKANTNLFNKQGIPFNFSDKLVSLTNKKFKLTEDKIELQKKKYIPTNEYITTIKNRKDYIDKINYLKRNDLYKQLIEKIQKSLILNQKILKVDNKCLDNLNNRINNLEESKEIIDKIEQVFKEDNIDEELKEKIRDWYKIHFDKDHCIFCGNKSINKAKEKWKEVFNNAYIEEKKKIKSELEDNIKVCEDITNINQYKEIDKEIYDYIDQIKQILSISKKNIENGIYEQINILNISKEVKTLEVNKLIDDIINYTLNQSLKELEFFYNASLCLKDDREKATKELDKIMDGEGDIIATNINSILADLGLNKNINITVDRRSKPYKFTYNIENHKEVGELSDGQKHKLALSIFINSIINDNLEGKIIVIDDPVVSLDILSYIQFKQLLIKRVIKQRFKDSTTLLLLTHDITYLYIQISNIFDDENMKKDTIIYKLSDKSIQEIPLDYFKTDDITLFRIAINKCSNITELKCINRITAKIFRIIIDIRLRFYGISDTSKVVVKKLPIDSEKIEKLQKYSNLLSRVARESNPELKDILEGIKSIKRTADLFGITDFITEKNIKNIEKIIEKKIEGKLEDGIFDIIESVGNFLTTTEDAEMKGYVEHTRISYTRNLIGLDLEGFFNK